MTKVKSEVQVKTKELGRQSVGISNAKSTAIVIKLRLKSGLSPVMLVRHETESELWQH